MCDAPPPKEEDKDDDKDPVDNGDGENTTEPDPVDEETDDEKDPTTEPEVIDPTKDPVKPLDPNENKENQTKPPEVVTIVEESDDNGSLEIILIILVCVLVPLICILALIVHMFRKNKLNSVQAALARRNSAARLQQEYDEKMEAKGAPNIYGDDEKHGTAAKNGMIPDDASKQAIMA